eukprot:scaffold522750_cov35-Prasinocladus_malaysianus.AAC.1
MVGPAQALHEIFGAMPITASTYVVHSLSIASNRCIAWCNNEGCLEDLEAMSPEGGKILPWLLDLNRIKSRPAISIIFLRMTTYGVCDPAA